MKEGEGTQQTHTYMCIHKTHRHNSVVEAREKGGVGEVEVGKGEENGDRKRLCLGRRAPSVQMVFY